MLHFMNYIGILCRMRIFPRGDQGCQEFNIATPASVDQAEINKSQHVRGAIMIMN